MESKYDPDRLKSEMSKVIVTLWESNMGKCPLNAKEVKSLEWKQMAVSVPVVYVSRLGDEEKWTDAPSPVKAGAIMREMAEAYGMIEMLVDLDVVVEADVEYRSHTIPMVKFTFRFPEQIDLGITKDQHRLLMGTALLGWIKAHLMDAYRRDMQDVMQQTMEYFRDWHLKQDAATTVDPAATKH